MNLINTTHTMLSYSPTVNTDGTYFFHNSGGGFSTHITVNITGTKIKMEYKSRCMGSKSVNETLHGVIKHNVSDNYKIIKFDNCKCTFIFLHKPSPSLATSGLEDFVFCSNGPQWNKLTDLLVIPDNNHKYQYRELFNNILHLEYQYPITERSVGDYSSIPLSDSNFIFAYDNPNIYFPNLECYISNAILKGTILDTVFIDGSDMVSISPIENPKNFPKSSFIDTTYSSFMGAKNSGNGEDTCRVVLHKDDDVSKGVQDLLNCVYRTRVGKLQNPNGSDTGTQEPLSDNINIYTWVPEQCQDIIMLNTVGIKWQSDIQFVLEKYKTSKDIVHKIKVVCCLPFVTFDMGYVYVLQHFGKINNKSHVVLTIDSEDDCEKYLSVLS